MAATETVRSLDAELRRWGNWFNHRLEEVVFGSPESTAGAAEGNAGAHRGSRPTAGEVGDHRRSARAEARGSGSSASSVLVEAMRYTLLAPGKRLRPFLVCRCCELAGGTEEEALPAAAAVECVHSFSLIHDDLPAMDDDSMRRGQPASHVRFGEAVAILAGDALLARAFELLGRLPDAKRAARSMSELATAVGAEGMIGGQALDMGGQGRPSDAGLVDRIYALKTGRLMAASCRLGAIAAGAAESTIDALGLFGQSLGLAFQIVDDLLDVSSGAGQLGKTAGKDAAAGKQTLIRCVGMEQSRQTGRRHVEEARGHLARFGPEADDLRELAALVIPRGS